MKIIEEKLAPKNKIGKITKTGDVSPWPHEEATAKTLSPTARHTKTILKNLKEAKWQADYVVLDSRRMKGIPNTAILRELVTSIKQVPEIKRLKYITKDGKLLDIILFPLGRAVSAQRWSGSDCGVRTLQFVTNVHHFPRL